MASVVTEQSTITCTHQGQVQAVAGQSKLKVAGALVLVDGDLNLATISGCTTVANPPAGTVTCATTTPPTSGVATKLKVGGKGVLLDSVAGKTSGTVTGTPQDWSVQSAGQSRLAAV
jgi:hypothetical protein